MGPSVLGQSRGYADALFPPGSKLVFSTLVEFGFMFHLFILGLQINASLIKSIGRKALIIGLIGTMIPLVFGGTAYKILQHSNPSEYRGIGPLSVVTVNSMTSFIGVTGLLENLNILNTEIGQFASSMSLVSDAICWFLIIVMRNVDTALKYSPTKPLQTLVLVPGYYCILFFLLRPLVIWIVSYTPVKEPIKESHFIAILCIVMGNGLLAEYVGEHARFGAFALGLSLPNGPTLGANLIKKLDALCTGSLLQLYCTAKGFRTLFSSMAKMSTVKLEIIIFAGYIGKFTGTILPSIYYKMPFRESLTLTLIMCCKGVMELAIYSTLENTQVTQETIRSVKNL